MNNQEPQDDQPLVAVARAVKTRGLKGEIVADLLTDFPERFQGLSRLIAVGTDGRRKAVELENYWFHGDRIVLKLAGFDDPESARSLINSEFAVAEADRVKLPLDEYYDWELAGCVVETVDGRLLGRVREVMKTGGVDMLVINDQEEHEYFVPMAASIVLDVDLSKRSIRIDPPEGLLDL
ncbi:MAG TPA: ribosome maturation factor RimM [Pyrinomonadaceae bacterium]|nr:ribosome maturation factor RimM [Pyrinomonadaceae bacterium]